MSRYFLLAAKVAMRSDVMCFPVCFFIHKIVQNLHRVFSKSPELSENNRIFDMTETMSSPSSPGRRVRSGVKTRVYKPPAYSSPVGTTMKNITP